VRCRDLVVALTEVQFDIEYTLTSVHMERQLNASSFKEIPKTN
jgi:hypothetical protein